MKIKKATLQLLLARSQMNQSVLAQAAGISRQTLSMLVHGKDCRPETAGAIAHALGVDVKEIIEEA